MAGAGSTATAKLAAAVVAPGVVVAPGTVMAGSPALTALRKKSELNSSAISAATPSSPVAPKVKKGKARAQQIILNVETMLVQTLNQTNNNMGDVNNAIQGG